MPMSLATNRRYCTPSTTTICRKEKHRLAALLAGVERIRPRFRASSAQNSALTFSVLGSSSRFSRSFSKLLETAMLQQVDWNGRQYRRLRDWDSIGQLFTDAGADAKTCKAWEVCVMEMRQVFVGLRWEAAGKPVFETQPTPPKAWSAVKRAVQIYVKNTYGNEKLNYATLVREMTT